MSYWQGFIGIAIFSGLAIALYYKDRSHTNQVINPIASEPDGGPNRVPDYSKLPIHLGLVAAFGLVFIGVPQIWSRWIRPRHQVYRTELLKVAVPALHCQANDMTFEQIDELGVRVTGCGHTARFFLLTSKHHPPEWLPDSGCRESYFFVSFPC